jgi:outer membrane protein OmpA-like peptidoglycan-associated protein
MTAALALSLWLAGCAQQPVSVAPAAPVAPVAAAPAPAAPPPAAPAPPPVVQAIPFPDAVLAAANTVFSTAPRGDGAARQILVIDPLVDGVTGQQSNATKQIQAQIVALVAEKFPQFDVQPFSAAAVSRAPFVLVGTFTPVNAQGQTSGDREGFRFCLVMADLRSGKTVAKGVARAQMGGVDPTPTAFFRDSPAWSEDANIKGYINTCQATKVGDPISPVYLNGILAASIISDAIEAYNERRYPDALDLYLAAQKSQSGAQLRVYNGLYLTYAKLGRRPEMTTAFGQLVDYSLASDRLAVKLLFRVGSTAFVADQQVSGSYDMWLSQIAGRSAAKNACLQVTGHTSRSGSAVLNQHLSQLRAEYVKTRLESDTPALTGHVIADGAGSNAALIGTGADNDSDALDRRVEFKVIARC